MPGQTRCQLSVGYVQNRCRLVQIRCKPGAGQVRIRCRSGAGQVHARCRPGAGQMQTRWPLKSPAGQECTLKKLQRTGHRTYPQTNPQRLCQGFPRDISFYSLQSPHENYTEGLQSPGSQFPAPTW